MVMPSAIGSVKGTPISTTSASLPTWVRCSRNFSRLGNPAVTKATMAVPPRALRMASLIFSLGLMNFWSVASTVRSNVGMSLSPRPESPMRIFLPGFCLAQRFAPANACADSMAGRMPSLRQHSVSASSDSSSVAAS